MIHTIELEKISHYGQKTALKILQ